MFKIISVAFLTVFILTFCDNAKKSSIESRIRPEPDSIVADIQGLIGAHYSNDDLTRLAEPMAIEDLDAFRDASNGFGNNWSGQWEGYVSAPSSGKVDFYAESDKEFIVKISGIEVLHVCEGSDADSVSLKMKKGRQYHVNVSYLQKSRGADSKNGATFFRLLWGWKGTDKKPVPADALHYSDEQNRKWRYIGENYKMPFDFKDTTEYLLDPIRIKAPEFANLDFSLATGGLPVVPGVETYAICQANRENPKKAEGYGYTYQHHQDIAAWHGLLYVGWNTCKIDEDEWPSRELYSTSANGKDWTKPVEMFPQGISTPLRMYFFLSPNGRMLMIAGLRENNESLSERDKSGIVVREIYADHTLGEVYILRYVKEKAENQPTVFETSEDKGFVEACHQLLADHLYLSQQDYGNLLDQEHRMQWFDPKNWQDDDLLRDIATDFGKAMCFFKRQDGTLVAVSKRRWVTTSADSGKTWAQPIRPKSLITGGGKVWGQKISDGRYVLIYNPDIDKRWPLAMLTSNDGITFSNPMSINGELPEQRYEGKFKDKGVSYHRGLSKWNDDGTWKDNAIWLVSSLNKEDILISRIPVGKTENPHKK